MTSPLTIAALLVLSIGTASAISCFTCNRIGPTAAACAADPFTADGVSVVECPAGMPCLTVRTETAEGVATVYRRCGTEPKPDKCQYSFLDSSSPLKRSECYCNTDRCNTESYSPREPVPSPPVLKCYTCFDRDCGANPLDVDAAGVSESTCRAGQACVTIRNMGNFGGEYFERRCDDASEDKCEYNIPINNGRRTKCACNKDYCNSEFIGSAPPSPFHVAINKLRKEE